MKSGPDFNKHIGIVGAGGLGKEVLCLLGDMMQWKEMDAHLTFLVEPSFYTHDQVKGIQVLALDPEKVQIPQLILAIGDAKARIRLSKMGRGLIDYPSVVHPSDRITPYTSLGQGCIVLGQVLLSVDVVIGEFAVINPGTTISHDTRIGDYFTASPGVHISGNCRIGDRVFMGVNASIRDAISIGDDVIIGMGAVVTSDLPEPGTYIGNPAKRIK